MQGIFITIEKDELEDIVCRAVEAALVQAGFIREQNNSEDVEKLIMRSADLCRYLKMKLSTLYQLTHKNEIPFDKKGKTLYFKKTEIDKWVAEGKEETIMEQDLAREIRIGIADKKRLKTIA
jgi:excisionase family DNA binding protein